MERGGGGGGGGEGKEGDFNMPCSGECWVNGRVCALSCVGSTGDWWSLVNA